MKIINKNKISKLKVYKLEEQERNLVIRMEIKQLHRISIQEKQALI